MKIACKKMTVLGIVLGLVVVLFGGSKLYAHLDTCWGPGFSNPEMHAAMIRDNLTKELDLDSSQQMQLESMIQELLDKGIALHDSRSTARQEALGLLRENSVDRERIDELLSRHEKEIEDFITAAGHRMADFIEILTPEQRERLAKAIENHAGCPLFSRN